MTLAIGQSELELDLGRDSLISGRMDAARTLMEAEMSSIRSRCLTYLNWYSPPYEPRLGTHDAWYDPFNIEDAGLTRANFPVARAVVDIWTALEAAKSPALRAEIERVSPPPPTFDQAETQRNRTVYDAFRQLAAFKANKRASVPRDWMRRDGLPLKAYQATRRKNLYGFSWLKVWPNLGDRRPTSYAVRNPTTVYPIWSSREPGETEAVLVAYQISATKAAMLYPELGLSTSGGKLVAGSDSGVHRDLNDRWVNEARTMLWIEEYWWREVEYDREGQRTDSMVGCAVRVLNKIVKRRTYTDWYKLPWVYFENTDERDAYGWSDVAGVIDINDEINRRLSQQGDIIGLYSAPRFQLLNTIGSRDIEMPGPFELISLQDQEKIEQILTRIDTFPAQQHFQALIELLHRVSGLPPIVWGLIANAQTSGRALSASWKATETRLAPKILRDEQSYRDYLDLVLMYAERYNWRGARDLYRDMDGEPFRDFRWDFPPMEPRDFLEVTQNEITKRDAGMTTTVKAMRAMGDEDAEATDEEVQAEMLNIFRHPDKVQAFLLAQNAELANIAQAKELGVETPRVVNTASVAQLAGQAQQARQNAATPVPATEQGTLPPTSSASPVNAGEGPEGSLTSGTLFRQGNVSNQLLQTRRLR